MTQYSKYNIVYRLQKWMDSVPGQTFLNYAYSWGASIIILGSLFKLTHLRGADFFLFLGMGTEVFVFFISAFDRPFDKTADGMDLPTHLQDESEQQDVEAEGGAETLSDDLADEQGQPFQSGEPFEGNGHAGGPVFVGGGTVVVGGPVAAGEGPVAAGEGPVAAGEGPVAVGGVVSQLPQLNPDMESVTNDYVEQLRELTEMLRKVSEQSQKLTRDSEEMENLNRTLTGICKVYEMQLKSASQQIGTIDEINEQTSRMAGQIAELNKIYARMIEAMTVNLPGGLAK